jgi:hypothetical protein
MWTQVERPYQDGTLMTKDVPAVDGESQIALQNAVLIAQYVCFLNDKNILGDIEVTLPEIKQKFDS